MLAVHLTLGGYLEALLGAATAIVGLELLRGWRSRP